ncbi:MAG: hypothetical protein AAF632_29055 [Bacteroidota bacterium]
MEVKSNGQQVVNEQAISKAQAVRDYIKSNPRAKNKAIISSLKENGIEITDSYLNTIRNKYLDTISINFVSLC